MTKLGVLLSGIACLVAVPAAAQDLSAEVFSSWTSAGEAAALKVVSDAFTAAGGTWTDASIAGFENANAAFQARMTANDPPTAVQSVVGAQSKEYVDAGLFHALDAADWMNAMSPSLAASVTYGDKVYLAPMGLHGQSWMFMNKNVLAAAGVSTPFANWDEFFAGMEKLKAAGVTPIAWGGQGWQEGIVFNAILFSHLGVDGYNKALVTRDPDGIKADGIRAAFEVFGRMRDFVDAGEVGRNWNDATAMLINGTAGVQFMGDWAKGEFIAAGKGIGDEFGCNLAPGSDGITFIADAFAFPVMGDELSDAQKLLVKTMMDPAVQVGFSQLKGSIPARSDVDVSKLDECTQTGIAMLAAGKGVPIPSIVIPPSEVGEIGDLIAAYWSDPTMTPEAAAAAYTAILAKL